MMVHSAVLFRVTAGLLALAVGCSGRGAETPEGLPACSGAESDPRGPACSQSVETDAEFDALSLPVGGVPGWERATKYMVPARDDPSAIPALVQNANRYDLHRDFLEALFLPALDQAGYADLVMQRATRQYYAGNLIRINDPILGKVYGFTVYTAARASELLDPVEVRRVFEQLEGVVGAGALAYTFEPSDGMGPTRARTWIDPGFPIAYLASAPVKVEVYAPGTACGRVRLLTVDQLDQAVAAGTIGFRDLVVVDAVPFDIETVIAGLITGQRQWQLSHVNVRLARRGTPNLFVAEAMAELAAWEGRLVRLETGLAPGGVGDGAYTIEEIGEAEAEAWWASCRPCLDHVPTIDRTHTGLERLDAMDVDDLPTPLVSRYGGKTANLAKLNAILADRFEVPGFGIPFAGFEDFLDGTTVADLRAVPPEEVTLRELVRRLASDPEAAADATLERALLAALRAHVREDGDVPDALVDAVVAKIIDVFGSASVRVRFRSSSNVEDSLEFSGAGLYDSTTVCAADDLDGDSAGPSACDPGEADERGVERGLRHVWASLYNDRAWDERDWYQVPQEAAGMAVLVSLAYPDEIANGVAFTGDPADPADARYLVNVQLGDEPVVNNDASKIPEVDKLEITNGEVSWVYRLRSSSLATPGEPVLSDERLRELGGVMAAISRDFPVEMGSHEPGDVLLDLEFKVTTTGQLVFKQIRPYLRP